LNFALPQKNPLKKGVFSRAHRPAQGYFPQKCAKSFYPLQKNFFLFFPGTSSGKFFSGEV